MDSADKQCGNGKHRPLQNLQRRPLLDRQPSRRLPLDRQPSRRLRLLRRRNHLHGADAKGKQVCRGEGSTDSAPQQDPRGGNPAAAGFYRLLALVALCGPEGDVTADDEDAAQGGKSEGYGLLKGEDMVDDVDCEV